MLKMIRNKAQHMFETHIEDLVRPDHPYRKLLKAVDFKKLCKPLQSLFHETLGRKGYHVESGFTALVLQWMKENYWYGYKRSIAACMKFGFVTKVAVTPANITDSQALKHVCPKQGVVYADKGYSDQEAEKTMKSHGCENRSILKNNMKKKDFIRDAKISKKRMPFERVFSKLSKKALYRSVCKNQFQGFMQALAFNFKRLIVVEEFIALQS